MSHDPPRPATTDRIADGAGTRDGMPRWVKVTLVVVVVVLLGLLLLVLVAPGEHGPGRHLSHAPAGAAALAAGPLAAGRG